MYAFDGQDWPVSSVIAGVVGELVVCLTGKDDLMQKHQILCHMSQSPVEYITIYT